MRREAIDCENCPAQNLSAPVTVFNICVGSGYNGMESVGDYETVDLCPTCAGKALMGLLFRATMSDEDRKKWVEQHRRKK